MHDKRYPARAGGVLLCDDPAVLYRPASRCLPKRDI